MGCSAATSPCIEKLVFRTFATPPIGAIFITNKVKRPLATDPLGAGTFGCAPAPGPDAYGSAPFHVDVSVINLHGVNAGTLLFGSYARGKGQ